MTDCALVRQELKKLFSLTDEDIKDYDSLIISTVNSVHSIIKNTKTENDVRIVHLCAVKAYYRITLIESENVSSFSAGEVSFSMDTSFASSAEKLLEEAMLGCSDLVNTGAFAFKAV